MSRDNRPPYFPFYPADFSSDGLVEAMTPQQLGAYILLICKAWWETPPASIPNDDSVLARWARMTPDDWKGCRAGVLTPFTIRADGRLYQKRLESEYAKFRRLKGMRSEAGQRGAEARWQPHGKAIGKGMATPMANDASSVPSSVPDFAWRETARAKRQPPVGSRPTPQGFHALVESHLRRVLTGNRGITANESRSIAEWTMGVEKMPPVDIRGTMHTATDLAVLSLGVAEASGVNSGVKPLLAYVGTILDRCMRQHCLPNEQVQATPAQMKIVTAPRDYSKILDGL